VKRLVIGLGLALVGTPAFAVDLSGLPQSCKDSLAQMQGEKAKFGELSRAMTQNRKASRMDAFCQSARDVLTLIKEQSSRLDYCIGDLASATVPQAAASQMLQLKAVYRQMLDAAKDAKNDHMHCGLANE
jgi:hypothetical protein